MNETAFPKPMHRRVIDNQSWMHEDGAIEIHSRLVDTKGYEQVVGLGKVLAPGEALHDMTIKLVVDRSWEIRTIVLEMPHTPFDVCPQVMAGFYSLKGESMSHGWNSLLNERFKGGAGCRHILDLLRGMATVLFQTLAMERKWDSAHLENLNDSCFAFRDGGEVMVELRQRAKAQPDS